MSVRLYNKRMFYIILFTHLKIISCVLLLQNPHARLKIKNSKDVSCKINVRPYTSEIGLTSSGSTADAIIKTDKISPVSASDWILKSSEIASKAGATMEEETGDMNMKRETRIVIPQRLLVVQSIGFSGSFGLLHVTYGAF